TWLRDVAGYGSAQVARGLLATNLAMIVGYLGFGREADARARRGRSTLPLLAGGVALASVTLGLLVLGVRVASVALWCLFIFGSTANVLSFSMLSRRYPTTMTGRVTTAMNVFGFAGIFAGQWGIGVILDLWPRTAVGYAPQAYFWAFGAVWAIQLAGLVWLWRGRELLEARARA
ncbi:MAG: hypothetical protein WCA09_01945, partial [Burkholderiales bacterium]